MVGRGKRSRRDKASIADGLGRRHGIRSRRSQPSDGPGQAAPELVTENIVDPLTAAKRRLDKGMCPLPSGLRDFRSEKGKAGQDGQRAVGKKSGLIRGRKKTSCDASMWTAGHVMHQKWPWFADRQARSAQR